MSWTDSPGGTSTVTGTTWPFASSTQMVCCCALAGTVTPVKTAAASTPAASRI
jgi:ornithine cyclodeaminase/alanine dehydrogenase-like protein (mu-crystallin family)